jgi:hypothetical protein
LTPNSRSYLNRFSQPDTIIPDPYNSADYDRYSYARNNAIKYTDPSGHCVWDLCIIEGIGLIEVTAIAVGAITVTYYATTPPPAALTDGLEWANQQIAKAVDSISASVSTNTQTSQATLPGGTVTNFAHKPDIGFIDYLQKKYGLSAAERRALHDLITREGMTEEEIEAEAEEIVRAKNQKEHKNESDKSAKKE